MKTNPFANIANALRFALYGAPRAPLIPIVRRSYPPVSRKNAGFKRNRRIELKRRARRRAR